MQPVFGKHRDGTSNSCRRPDESLQSAVPHGMELETVAIPAPSLVSVEAPGSTTLCPVNERDPGHRGGFAEKHLSVLVLWTLHTNTGFATGRYGAGDVEVGPRGADDRG